MCTKNRETFPVASLLSCAFCLPAPCDRVNVCMSRAVVFGTMPSFCFCLNICCLPKTEAYLYNVFFFSEHPDQTMSALLLIKRKKILEINKVLAQGKIKHACVVSFTFFFFLLSNIFGCQNLFFDCLLLVWFPCYCR